MLNKKGFEFSFSWLFAMLAGAAILFLAIYGAVSFVRIGGVFTDTTTMKEISNLFEVMETGLAEGRSNVLHLRETTRIYNSCETFGTFGEQEFTASTRKRFGEEWTEPEPGQEITIGDKYVFSDRRIQGDQIYFFSKPFEMPWKVSELIFLSADPYCFVNPPGDIDSGIPRDEKLMNNVRITNNIGNCTAQEITVCFGQTGCDIRVEGDSESGTVIRGTQTMHYVGNLMYGAIFSNNETYECNVRRLMSRLKQQASLLGEQSSILRGTCGTVSSSELLVFSNIAGNLQSSAGLQNLLDQSENINQKNTGAECRLW